MKTEILRKLKEANDYLSGQELSDSFQVSRTAIWKAIGQLKEEGYQIDAVRNRGYRLRSCPDVLDEAELQSTLNTRWAGQKVVYFPATDSTNNQAKNAGENGEEDGTLFVAEQQQAGRGRRDRTWVSPSGSNIYLSLLMRPRVALENAPMLTLVMGLSVTEALRELTGLPLGIKWPNDVVLDGKKICGILTEMSTEMDAINYVVIGVGINVNQETFPAELSTRATSLKQETGVSYRRADVIDRVLQKFEAYEDIFLQTEDLGKLLPHYQKLLVNQNRDVEIMDPKGSYEARALGINARGELLVKLADGKEQAVYGGEVSLRGEEAYV